MADPDFRANVQGSQEGLHGLPGRPVLRVLNPKPQARSPQTLPEAFRRVRPRAQRMFSEFGIGGLGGGVGGGCRAREKAEGPLALGLGFRV